MKKNLNLALYLIVFSTCVGLSCRTLSMKITLFLLRYMYYKIWLTNTLFLKIVLIVTNVLSLKESENQLKCHLHQRNLQRYKLLLYVWYIIQYDSTV